MKDTTIRQKVFRPSVSRPRLRAVFSPAERTLSSLETMMHTMVPITVTTVMNGSDDQVVLSREPICQR